MTEPHPDEPCYSIGIVARMVDLHPQTLRKYEEEGLVVPKRSTGNIRLYSPNDVARLQKIARLTGELGVNLAGVHIILNLTAQIEELQGEQERLRIRLDEQRRRRETES
ncbi:MAG: MerR family transcriptional regulator [Anaerolineae bacterium]|nr:MerR family transcriptional regulator [Anaerolineae bacterium]